MASQLFLLLRHLLLSFPQCNLTNLDEGFARMEYTGKNQFSLLYETYRQWWEIYSELSLDECLAKIR